jgi:hypothetical protein
MGIHCIAAISYRLRHRLVQKDSDRGARSDEARLRSDLLAPEVGLQETPTPGVPQTGGFP